MTLKPSARLLVSSIPIIVLTLLLSLSVSIFKSDSILGASQVALLVSAGVAIALSIRVAVVGPADPIGHPSRAGDGPI